MALATVRPPWLKMTMKESNSCPGEICPIEPEASKGAQGGPCRTPSSKEHNMKLQYSFLIKPKTGITLHL